MPNTILPVSSSPSLLPNAPVAPAPSAEMLAYERMKPAMLALAASKDLTPIAMDTTSMVVAVLKSLPRLGPMRDAIVGLPDVDARSIDELEASAHALVWANVQYQMATRPPERLAAVYERANELRSQLHPAVMLLVNRGLVDGRELAGYTGMKGYKLVAADLALLAGVLRKEWAKLHQKTPVTPDEVQEASRLGLEILAMVAERAGSPVVVAEANRMRAAAYNLLLQRYREVRAAVQFLRRREDDADELAPSLFAGRGHKSDASDEPEATSENAPPEVAPITSSLIQHMTKVSPSDDDPFES